jgi:OFA family oxalate/formate antiporter-like MFS transporter
VVLAATVLNFFAGGVFFYGFSVFFNPIRDTFGWSAAVTSVAFAFRGLEQGGLGPVAGFLVDRVGPRKLMLSGWALVGLGFLLMSRINSLGLFYATFLVIATGMSFGTFVVSNTAVANWFHRKRSRAMTIVYAGYGASGLLVPLLALFISEFGWRESLTFIAIVLWCTCVPLCLLMRNRPSEYGYLPDGDRPIGNVLESIAEPSSAAEKVKPVPVPPDTSFTARAAMRTRAFWLLAVVLLFQSFGQSAVMVHIVPYLESVKIPTELAALGVTGLTLCSLIGRVGFGFLGDFASKRYLLTIALVLQAIGLFIFSFVGMAQAWLMVPFLLTFAPGYGGTLPVRPALQADYFGVKSFGMIMGLMSLIGSVGGLVSPVIAGWIFDTTGNYQFAWRLFAIVTVPAVPLMMLARPPKAPRPIT